MLVKEENIYTFLQSVLFNEEFCCEECIDLIRDEYIVAIDTEDFELEIEIVDPLDRYIIPVRYIYEVENYDDVSDKAVLVACIAGEVELLNQNK